MILGTFHIYHYSMDLEHASKVQVLQTSSSLWYHWHMVKPGRVVAQWEVLGH